MLFSKAYWQKFNRQLLAIKIQVRSEKLNFNKEIIRWLEIWVNNQLKFSFYIYKRIKRAYLAKI